MWRRVEGAWRFSAESGRRAGHKGRVCIYRQPAPARFGFSSAGALAHRTGSCAPKPIAERRRARYIERISRLHGPNWGAGRPGRSGYLRMQSCLDPAPGGRRRREAMVFKCVQGKRLAVAPWLGPGYPVRNYWRQCDPRSQCRGQIQHNRSHSHNDSEEEPPDKTLVCGRVVYVCGLLRPDVGRYR